MKLQYTMMKEDLPPSCGKWHEVRLWNQLPCDNHVTNKKGKKKEI